MPVGGLAVAVLPLALWTAGTLSAVIGALLAFGITGGLMNVALTAQGVRMERAHGRPLMASFYAALASAGWPGRSWAACWPGSGLARPGPWPLPWPAWPPC